MLMTRGVFRFVAAVLLAVGAGAAQDPARPSFDVAPIRHSGSKDAPTMSATTAGINYGSVTLRACIATAYDVQESRVSGPAWLDSERYDISAKTGESATTAQLHLMLQSLLADRFKVTLHHDKKDLPVLALVVGKQGSKLPPATGEEPGGAASIKVDVKAGVLVFQKTSMESLAQYLSKFPAAGRPVVDRTELKGVYDFKVNILDSAAESTDDRQRVDNIKSSLRDGTVILSQIGALGLKLEQQHAPVDVLVVDHAEKVPTDN
jgi:uncharacterized protein (TIGR03435 family)